MPDLSHKLYIRVAMAIAVVAMSVSLLTASAVYWLSLTQERQVNTGIVHQIAASAEKTSAIAAYLRDEELAQEIINGLVSNDLVSGAAIAIADANTIKSGEQRSPSHVIALPLVNPFSGDEIVGTLHVVANDDFILTQARGTAMQNAGSLLLLSLITAGIVALVVHRRLTSPLRKLTKGFEQVDPNSPKSMKAIDIGYKKPDEIGTLIGGINALMSALKHTLQTERTLRERTEKLEQRFRLIFEQASAGIGLLDNNNGLQSFNPALKALFKQIEEGDNFTSLFIDVEKVSTTLAQMRTLEPFEQIALDLEYSVDSERRWLHCLFAKISEQRQQPRQNQDILIEVIAYDITDRKLRESKTRFEADHDSLTQLRNRRSGERAMEDLLNEALLRGHRCVLMMIDLDKFKPVNDTYGHDVGDVVLVTVSHRIRQFFDTQKDVCIRWGGDEFVVAFSRPAFQVEAISSLAQQLLEALREPIQVSPTITCQIGGSIGIVIAPDQGDQLDSLLNLADETMYRVKQQGRNQYLIAEGELKV